MAPPRGSRRGAATVLVTDAGRGSAIACLRSLGRAGYRVVAADADPRSPGFRSRYAFGRVVYPDPRRDPERFLRALRDAVGEWQVELVVPVTDDTLLPLAEARKDFEGLCALAVPETSSLEVVADKWRTLEWAERLAIAMPRTHLVRSPAEAVAAAPDLRAPFVLKPRRSRLLHDAGVESFEVAYARDVDELASAMRRFEGRCDVLLQEFVRGRGAGVEVLADAGRPLAVFAHRRLHELPVHGGRSALRESAPLDPALREPALRLLDALEWTGLAMVEFKLTERGPVLMEVNGRIWGSLPLAVQSGVDFPRLLAELHLVSPPGPEAEPATVYLSGVRARHLELELKWIASVLFGRRHPFLPRPRRREGLAALAGLLDPRVHSDVQSLADPGPGLADLARIARAAARRLRRKRA
jgi:predicted ATP-grasp superfamily ATP-dependent carboligase